MLIAAMRLAKAGTAAISLRRMIARRTIQAMVKSAKKHVIFLGAGASHRSGYPLANELRVLMSSPRHLKQRVEEYENKHHLIGGPIWRQVEACCLKRNEKALQLFRNGCFATLDEFCKLAGSSFREEIHGLRRMARAVLGMSNPEDDFTESEYYPFVQSMFEDDLVTLRSDIAVLTYNYDPYLEYLLYRALNHRWKLSGTPDRINLWNSVTSGFHTPQNTGWSDQSDTFCVLKLHGSICYVDEPLGFESLFEKDAEYRGEHLFAHEGNQFAPPLLFPWELASYWEPNRVKSSADDGRLAVHHDRAASVLRSVWKRARREVQDAERISFVGVSMHPFIEDGLRHLFEGKKNKAEIIIANPSNIMFDTNRRSQTHWSQDPQSLGSAVAAVMRKVAPQFSWTGKLPNSSRLHDGEMTLVKDFEGFIRTQLKPVPNEMSEAGRLEVVSNGITRAISGSRPRVS